MKSLRRQIQANNGNEMLFQGRVDARYRVVEVKVLTRGNRMMTPALLNVVAAGEVVIHNHPSGELTPSDADVMVASELGAQGVGSLIVNNQVSAVYAVVEPLKMPAKHAIDQDEVVSYFKPDGLLAKRLPSYEYRQPQVDMAAAVTGVFNDPGIMVIEAGTGVGKSLGYLIPAALWVLANRKRAVISTNTINLQEQLIKKDIPLLTDHLQIPVQVVLVKGRHNYLCRKKMEEWQADATMLPGLEAEDRQLMADICAWAATTSDGSLADLPVIPGTDIWEQCNSEADICLGAKCFHFERCFFYQARRRAAAAHLLIVNHHLLLADQALPAGARILPKYEAVIFDEGHHVEEAATSHLGESASRLGLGRTMARLASQRRPQAGVLARLYQRLESVCRKGNQQAIEPLLALLEADLLPAVAFLPRELGDLFSRWRVAFSFLEAEPGSEGQRAFKLRLTDTIRRQPLWKDDILPLAKELGDLCAPLLHGLDQLDHGVETGIRDQLLGVEQFDFLLSELRGIRSRLQQQLGIFARFFLADNGDPELIYWVEISGGRRLNLKVVLSPLDVGSVLAEQFYPQFETTIMTSATLAVDRRFDYFLSRVGLDRIVPGKKLETLLLNSPFDYQRQCLLVVPDDLPPPAAAAYPERLADFLADLISTVGGRAMILFTSYLLMNRITDQCRQRLGGQGFLILKQGEGQRHQLLHEFKNNPAAVLLATDSFWEGVDVKGRALETLVIVRLPFKVPTDPVVQARTEHIVRQGGDPFRDYALPQAAIKLKQGVGRLIRGQSDRGIVVVTDNRLVSKSYGLQLQNSLPMQRALQGNSAYVLSLARDFFNETASG
ncbi:MAG: helicase [Deltaproteobacteria bacterium]|nr:helicase [Candidatus Anaeroferrophillus wilburensis]MBN2889803.1 helicase [Deltaproteobacteria bacterium]